MTAQRDLRIPMTVFKPLLDAAKVIANTSDIRKFLMQYDPQALDQLDRSIKDATATQLDLVFADTVDELLTVRPIPNFEPDPLPDEVRFALDDYYEELDEWLTIMSQDQEDD